MWRTKMKTRDVFGYSFSAIRLRKLRAGLTTLGVVIGIAAIVGIAAGAGSGGGNGGGSNGGGTGSINVNW